MKKSARVSPFVLTPGSVVEYETPSYPKTMHQGTVESLSRNGPNSYVATLCNVRELETGKLIPAVECVGHAEGCTVLNVSWMTKLVQGQPGKLVFETRGPREQIKSQGDNRLAAIGVYRNAVMSLYDFEEVMADAVYDIMKKRGLDGNMVSVDITPFVADCSEFATKKRVYTGEYNHIYPFYYEINPKKLKSYVKANFNRMLVSKRRAQKIEDEMMSSDMEKLWDDLYDENYGVDPDSLDDGPHDDIFVGYGE